MIQLTLESPNLPSLVGYVSTSPRPLSRNRVSLRVLNESTASLVLDHSSSLFSTNRDVFVHLIVEEETDSLIPYTLSSQAAFSSVLRPDSQGVFAFSTGGNCSSVEANDEVFGFFMLDFTSKLFFDAFSLSFTVQNFEGDVEIALSDRVWVRFASHSQTLRSNLVESEPWLVRGGNPLRFTVPSNSSVFQLEQPIYLRVQPFAAESAASSLCYFNVSMQYLLQTEVRIAPYDSTVFVETPARSSIAYHAVWIPSEDLGTVSHVNLLFSSVNYSWNANGTVCLPLTIYYGYGSEISMLNIADSAAVVFTESFYYQPSIAITVDRSSVGCFLLVAVRTRGASSWAFEGSVDMTPFLLTPSNSIKGSLSSYRNFVQTYIFLYSTEYTPITLSATKSSSDYRSLYDSPALSRD